MANVECKFAMWYGTGLLLFIVQEVTLELDRYWGSCIQLFKIRITWLVVSVEEDRCDRRRSEDISAGEG
jgi:hypothetical protein